MKLVCGRKCVQWSVRPRVCVPEGWRGPCLQPLGAPRLPPAQAAARWLLCPRPAAASSRALFAP